jgi:hypothetical protein
MSGLHALDRRDPAAARKAWDTAHLVASLQGVVNRERPRLFVRFVPQTDDFWFNWLRATGNWLADAQVIRIESLEGLLRTFRADIKGAVVYKEDIAATSNLASTIAGVEDRVCLRFDEAGDSIYQQNIRFIVPDVLRLYKDAEEGRELFSSKCGAYLWAMSRYLDRCSTEYMAYYIDAFWLKRPTIASLDNNTLTNHDFFISHRAFFFDLDMWEEESPVDDPAQKAGTDVLVLRRLMRAMHDRANGKIIHIGGFVPWAWKYTNHGQAGGKHGGVDSEWKYAQIISSYNGIMDADAIGISGMANASFYQHFPLREHYPQNPRPTVADLKKRGFLRDDGSVAPFLYVMFYMGDYDSAAWLNVHVPKFWNDPARGSIPCAWAVNPNLDRRAPHAMHYIRTNASANDWFIAGDSGAGYLNPGMLFRPRLEADLPEGGEAWVNHNLPYFKRYDLSITGFIIDGHSPAMGQKGLDAYMRFSPDGIIGQKLPAAQGLHRGAMPYITMKMDLDGSPEKAGATVAQLANQKLPAFAPNRTILK